jgi:hypothetical protein
MSRLGPYVLPPRRFRGIAQLVERWSPKPQVVSSNLTAPATFLVLGKAYRIKALGQR